MTKLTIARGPYPGTRWTIIRRATPAQRSGTTRRRVLCRCVCGLEQPVYEMDLSTGRTSGCKSTNCRARWEAAESLRGQVEAMLAAFLRRPYVDHVAESTEG